MERKARVMARVKEELPKSVPLPPFDQAGLDVSQFDLLSIASVRSSYDEVSALLHRCGGLLRALRDSRTLPVNRVGLEHHCEALRQLATNMMKNRPAAACLACKRIPEVMGECTYCWGCGWVPLKLNEQLPPELLSATEPMVRFRGKLIPAAKG